MKSLAKSAARKPKSMIIQETADGTDTSGVRLRPCNANEVLLSISEGGLKSSVGPKHPKAFLQKVIHSFFFIHSFIFRIMVKRDYMRI